MALARTGDDHPVDGYGRSVEVHGGCTSTAADGRRWAGGEDERGAWRERGERGEQKTKS